MKIKVPPAILKPLPSALRAAIFSRGEGTCPPLWGGWPRQGAGEVPREGFCFRRCHICRWSRQASCGSHLFRQPFGLPPSPEGKAFALPFGEVAPARGRERCPEGASVFVGATFVGGADKLPAEDTSSVSPSGCHRKRGYIATGNAVDFRFAALCSTPEGKAFALPFGEGAPARGRERCPEGTSVFVGTTFVGGADKLPAEVTSSVSPSGCHRKRGYIATGNAVDFRFAALCSTPKGKAGCAPPPL